MATLTREHVPPFKAFNWDRAQGHTGEEWLASENGDYLGAGRNVQGGISGFTLCTDCNAFTGSRYGGEYARWARTAHLAFDANPPIGEGGSEAPEGIYALSFGGEIYPGWFVRQALATMCTVSVGALSTRAPEIRSMILDGAAGALPDEMGLYVALFASRTRSRVLAPMALVDLSTGRIGEVCELTHYPFSLVLVLSGREVVKPAGADIGKWLELPPSARVESVELETPIARCNTIFPGDYRSKARIAAESGLAAL